MSKNAISIVASIVIGLAIGGCWRNMDPHLAAPYNHTVLNATTSAQVLTMLNNPETEERGDLLSQSDTVAASYGQDGFKDGKAKRRWMTLVSFDEQTAVAKRKYFFYVDEWQRRFLLWHPKWGSRFDAMVVVDPAVLEKPYANENLRRVAILEYVHKNFREDVAKVVPDNKFLDICNDTVNETFNTLLRNLRESPAYAAQLSTETGYKFDHNSFYDATAYMSEADGVVIIKFKTGSVYKQKENPNEPNDC